MRHSPLIAAALYLSAGPALASDDEYGAYLFKGTCASYAPESVVEDIGDLDLETGPSKEWLRLSPDNAPVPNPVHIEDESTGKVTADQLAAGKFAIVITQTDSRNAEPIACGEIPQGATLPFVGNLTEMDGSGIVGRIAIEAHKKGVKITTAAFAKDAVPNLEQ